MAYLRTPHGMCEFTAENSGTALSPVAAQAMNDDPTLMAVKRPSICGERVPHSGTKYAHSVLGVIPAASDNFDRFAYRVHM